LVEKTQNLPEECTAVRVYAESLLTELQKHDATGSLPPQTAGALSEAIGELTSLANDLKLAHPFARAYEISWTQKLPELKEKFMRCLAMFSVESVVCPAPTYQCAV
jgi:hypothetical protein